MSSPNILRCDDANRGRGVVLVLRLLGDRGHLDVHQIFETHLEEILRSENGCRQEDQAASRAEDSHPSARETFRRFDRPLLALPVREDRGEDPSTRWEVHRGVK